MSALALQVEVSAAQGTCTCNRAPEHLTYSSDSLILDVLWSLSVEETTVAHDMSTRLELRVNGSTVSDAIVDVLVDGGSSSVCQTGPPCIGTCGSVTVGGVGKALNCYKDCVGATCVCKCGIWISTPIPIPTPLRPEDEIMVILYPAPGAAPEDDTSDDISGPHTFHGESIYWNRGIEVVRVVPVPGGASDVEVEGTVEFDEVVGSFMDLSFHLDLQLNGTVVATEIVSMDITPDLSGSCFYLGCDAYCGSVNSVDRYCEEVHFSDCGCGGGWLRTFPDVPVDPEDDLVIILRPVPGALPELPGFEEDDERRPEVSVSVEQQANETTTSLLSTQPNPIGVGEPARIAFQLGEAGHASLEIFDAAGKQVATIVDESLEAGRFQRVWDGTNATGRAVASGTYFVRLATGAGVDGSRILVLR